MIARLFALKLFAAILFTCPVATALCAVSPSNLPGAVASAVLSGVRPSPSDLPNDCGIIAAEALSRLKATGDWTRVIAIDALAIVPPLKPIPIHHILTVFQYDPKSNVLIYDLHGTAELATKSHDIKAIVIAFENFTDNQLFILEAHFLSPEVRLPAGLGR